ncbi:MAG TPA: T9SS type A sorting domain-containing protein, partial [Panacibacter sp.]|nr:T9SS type A sorting domain-containing protein [Panacibacter sp.]
VAVGLARYKTDGSLDSSFGINGLVITSSIASKVYTTDMVLQNDGKILVTGYKHNDENDNSTLFIVRYLPDGSLDESFSEDGIVLSVFATGIEPPSIAWQPDGKILIAADNPFADRFTIARYLSDGNLDPAFGTAGITIFNFPDITGSDLYDIALQQDGKIVAVGDTYQLTDGDPDMTVARFDTNGVIDNTFGNGKGFVVTEFGSDFSEAHSVAIQADGKIVVSGQSYNDRSNPIHFYYALARYLSNGGLDSTFSNNGLKTTDLGGFANSVANAIQQDGKILLAGNFYNEAEGNHIAIVRYNNDEIFPITYNKFTATQTKAFITLNWQTTTELNNSYFAVERSSNAVNYTSVAQVNSAATGAAIHDYAYTDKLPIAGSNYYRLKQVDKDGKYSYSKTVSINYLKPGSIQLYPNPAKDKLTAKGLNAANASTIVVLDIQGKQLLKFSAKAATYSFSIGSLAPGTYMVRVKDNNGTAVEKFVKQ